MSAAYPAFVGVALTETDRRLLDQLVKTRRTTKSRLVRGLIRREGQQVEAVLGNASEYSAVTYHSCHMQTDEFTATLSPCFCRFHKRLQRTTLHAPIATDARSFQLPRLDESLNRLPGELQPTSDLLCGQQGIILSFRALGCFDRGLLARHR